MTKKEIEEFEEESSRVFEEDLKKLEEYNNLYDSSNTRHFAEYFYTVWEPHLLNGLYFSDEELLKIERYVSKKKPFTEKEVKEFFFPLKLKFFCRSMRLVNSINHEENRSRKITLEDFKPWVALQTILNSSHPRHGAEKASSEFRKMLPELKKKACEESF
ncbi:MAG: hypothetical protein WC346_09320 [Methanogenium sp.]